MCLRKFERPQPNVWQAVYKIPFPGKFKEFIALRSSYDIGTSDLLIDLGV